MQLQREALHSDGLNRIEAVMRGHDCMENLHFLGRSEQADGEIGGFGKDGHQLRTPRGRLIAGFFGAWLRIDG